jgi:hypothetical protein
VPLYVGIVADVEGLVISFMLAEWKPDVPSFLHAFKFRVVARSLGVSAVIRSANVQHMVGGTIGRLLLAALMGAGAYLALLHVSYAFIEGSYYPPPQWWRDHLHPRPVASASWFVLINAAGAVLAAIPVALGLVLLAKTHKLTLGLAVGVPASLYIMGSGLVAYGFPQQAIAWVIEVFQFLSIGLAVLLSVVLCSKGGSMIGIRRLDMRTRESYST